MNQPRKRPRFFAPERLRQNLISMTWPRFNMLAAPAQTRNDRTRRSLFCDIRLLLGLMAWVMLLLPLHAPAQLVEVGDGGPGPVKAEHLTAEMTSLRPQIAAGGTVEAGLALAMEEHWHVYWQNAGDSGEPPKITWTLPPGITADPMQFPPPQRLPLGPLMDFGYETQVAFPVLLHAAAGMKPGKVHLDAKVNWLVCAAQCLPGKAHLGLNLEVVPGPLTDPPLVGALGAAINSLPKPLPAGMNASAVGGPKAIAVTVKAGAGQKDVEFYPFDQDQIENAAPQGVEQSNDGVRVVLTRASDSTVLPKTLHGLLELDGGRAYEFTVPVVAGAVAPAAVAASTSGSPAGASGGSDATLLGELALAFVGGLLM